LIDMKADRELRDLILEVFHQEGDTTIAEMVRQLERRGVKHHRLTVTGYLHALADAGYLEVRSVPPAKLFSLKASPSRTLPAVMGACARRMVNGGENRAMELTVGGLERLLDRAVFMSEIAEAGFYRTGNLRQLGKKERTEEAKRLDRCGVAVREGEPMFRAREVDPVEVNRLLDETLLEAMDAQKERPREVVQTSLTLEQFG
jgi:DNA-binding PadR family transcriptional regulator